MMRMYIRNFFVSASILDSSSDDEISDSGESDRYQEFLRLISSIPEKETKAPAENENNLRGSHHISPDGESNHIILVPAVIQD